MNGNLLNFRRNRQILRFNRPRHFKVYAWHIGFVESTTEQRRRHISLFGNDQQTAREHLNENQERGIARRKR